jgi:3-oxoadipate enol-lactonase
MWREQGAMRQRTRSAMQECAQRIAAGLFMTKEIVAAALPPEALLAILRRPKQQGNAMPHAVASDNVRLYYEEAGNGTPILFLHEFAADHTNWEPQMRYFSRGHRCIAYSARGYTPSDVPPSPEVYTYRHFYTDALAVLDHLGIEKAHFVGLSMGSYSSLHVSLNAPARMLSMTLAGVGSGSGLEKLDAFRQQCRDTAAEFERLGSAEVAKVTREAPGRIPFLVKDPRGHADFYASLARHDAKGSANTMRGFQGGRPSIYTLSDAIRKANNLQQSWRFDWEPPKAVLRDVRTIDWILGG